MTENTDRDPIDRIVDWIKKRQRTFIGVAAIVVLSIAGFVYMKAARERREHFASSLVANARAVAYSGNLALAITDLSEVTVSHRGTVAAEEAEILLAQLRLSEGQAEGAVRSLQEYVERGPSEQFRAPAYGLLGVALEQTVNLADAAVAYHQAADAAWYDFLKAQYLLDAGRVRTEIGDTAVAVSIYQRILDELPETDMVMEARLRLGELLKSDIDNR